MKSKLQKRKVHQLPVLLLLFLGLIAAGGFLLFPDQAFAENANLPEVTCTLYCDFCRDHTSFKLMIIIGPEIFFSENSFDFEYEISDGTFIVPTRDLNPLEYEFRNISEVDLPLWIRVKIYVPGEQVEWSNTLVHPSCFSLLKVSKATFPVDAEENFGFILTAEDGRTHDFNLSGANDETSSRLKVLLDCPPNPSIPFIIRELDPLSDYLLGGIECSCFDTISNQDCPGKPWEIDLNNQQVLMLPDNGNEIFNCTFNNTISQDLSVAITDCPDPVLLGDNVKYTVSITNGGSVAANPKILVRIPQEVFLEKVILDDDGSWSESGDILTFDIGSISSGEVVEIDIVGTTLTPGIISGEVLVVGDTYDPNAENNTALEETTVINDECPDDPDKIAPGICGCGVSDVDTDGDGTPDCNARGPRTRRRPSK